MNAGLDDQSGPGSRPKKQRKTISSGPRIRKSFYSLDAYTRHKILINEYRLNHPGATALLQRDTSGDKTDYDVLTQHHRFLWDSDDDEDHDEESNPQETQPDKQSWGRRLAKKYYDSLFKEFAICDLSRYKDNKVAMRWRIEHEVVEGKGQFVCGEKSCSVNSDLRTWEVNFKYEEQGATNNALVKLRLCPKCSDKLNYKHQKREVKYKKKKKRKRDADDERREKRRERRKQTSPQSSSSPADSDADRSASKPRSGRKKHIRSHGDEGERFLDQFWEDMMS